MMKVKLVGLLVLGLASMMFGTASAAVVNAPNDVARWRAVTTSETEITWDWSWDWVPSEAVTARLKVRGGRRKTLHDAVYAKPDSTATVDFGTVTSTNEDVYAVTLEFRDGAGAVLATKTATLDALAGNIGAAKARVAANDSPIWIKAGGPAAVVPYPDGNELVRGNGLVHLTYQPEGAAEPLFEQDVEFQGMGFLWLLK